MRKWTCGKRACENCQLRESHELSPCTIYGISSPDNHLFNLTNSYYHHKLGDISYRRPLLCTSSYEKPFGYLFSVCQTDKIKQVNSDSCWFLQSTTNNTSRLWLISFISPLNVSLSVFLATRRDSCKAGLYDSTTQTDCHCQSDHISPGAE